MERFRPRFRATRPDEAELYHRLQSHGLRPIARLRLTDNRSVMVSFSPARVLSVHRAFAGAPDEVILAIVRFVAPGTRRETRKAAEQAILGYRLATREPDPGTRPRSTDRPQPGDPARLARLRTLFDQLNARHFGGRLSAVPIRVSGRLKSRLGHVTLHQNGTPCEITLSRRHIVRHGWDEASHTLLHEMVHLWQHAEGYPVDHGPRFRAKARAVGITPAARRDLRGR